jgi:hypothetical protein
VDVVGERRRDNSTAVVGPRMRRAGARRGRDRRCQQEEAPAEEERPDRGRCGGALARLFDRRHQPMHVTSGGAARTGLRTSTGGGAGGRGTTRSWTSRGSFGAIIQPTSSARCWGWGGRHRHRRPPTAVGCSLQCHPPRLFRKQTLRRTTRTTAHAQRTHATSGGAERTQAGTADQQEEAPAEEGQPDRGRRGGGVAR